MKFTDKITIPGAPGKIDENGFLRLQKVRLGRIGIQKYLGKELPSHLGFEDNEVVSVLRPEDEVFSDDSLATLQGIPAVIKDHEWKTPDNNNSAGSVSGIPERDGDDILGQLLITDGKAIAPIQDKRLSDISLGYQAEVSLENGTFRGETYQAVQRKIRYNHVAILRPGGGRAGDNIKIEDKRAMELITVDTGHGEVKVSPDSKSVLKSLMDACSSGKKEQEKLQDSNKDLAGKLTDFDALKIELEDAKKKVDEMKGELKAKNKELEDAEDPEELEKKAKELNDAQTVGKIVMGDKMPKGLAASALKMAIAKHYAKENGLIGDSESPSDAEYVGIYRVASAAALKNPKKKVIGHEIIDHKISDARQKFNDELTGKGGAK